MDTRKILKLTGLNVAIAVLNIALFSPGLIGLKMGGADALSTAVGGTAIFISMALFIYGNGKLLMQKARTIPAREINSLDDCIPALKQAYGKRTFDGSISAMLEQIERLYKKKEKIREFLLQKFHAIDIGFERFNETILDMEYVFYTNIKSVINKINAFDEEEYRKITSNSGPVSISPKYAASKQGIYNEYISFVKNALEVNEEILLKLDALLLEISSSDSLEAGEIDNLKEVREMDKLISLYKNQ